MTKTYHDEDLGITMETPNNWEASSTDRLPLVLFAPAEDGFRANMTFSVRSLDPPTPENFDALIEKTRRDRADTYQGYILIDAERFMQDGYPAYRERYHWQDDDNETALTQVFALFLAGPDSLYAVHATTLRPLDAAYLPQFSQVILSLRFD